MAAVITTSAASSVTDVDEVATAALRACEALRFLGRQAGHREAKRDALVQCSHGASVVAQAACPGDRRIQLHREDALRIQRQLALTGSTGVLYGGPDGYRDLWNSLKLLEVALRSEQVRFTAARHVHVDVDVEAPCVASRPQCHRC